MASYRSFFGDMLCRHFLKRRCAVCAQTPECAGGGHRRRESLVAARGARPKLQCVEYGRSHRARDTSSLTACGREHDGGSGFSGERVIVPIGEVRRFIPAFLPVSRAAALLDALPGPLRKLKPCRGYRSAHGYVEQRMGSCRVTAAREANGSDSYSFSHPHVDGTRCSCPRSGPSRERIHWKADTECPVSAFSNPDGSSYCSQ